jgi:hypothetical protein
MRARHHEHGLPLVGAGGIDIGAASAADCDGTGAIQAIHVCATTHYLEKVEGLCQNQRRYSVIEWVMRRSAQADAMKQAGFQRRQDHLHKHNMLPLTDVDVCLELVVEAERYDCTFRTRLAQ